jgi:hypothetical protein
VVLGRGTGDREILTLGGVAFAGRVGLVSIRGIVARWLPDISAHHFAMLGPNAKKAQKSAACDATIATCKSRVGQESGLAREADRNPSDPSATRTATWESSET